ASAPRVGTQALAGSARLGGSLSPAARAVPGRAFSRSVREQQTRLTSPTCRTPPGQSAGTRRADPGTTHIRPAFDAPSISVPTLRQRSHPRDCAPSSWSPPDASPAPFPRRSPRRSSANAARGGLEPPPQGGSEGPSFISRTAPHQGASPTSTTFLSAFVTH